MSYQQTEKTNQLLEKQLGLEGVHAITSSDGAVTGNFSAIQAFTNDVTIQSLTLKNNCSGSSNIIAVSPIPSGTFLVGFTGIQITSGTLLIYGIKN